MKYDFDTNYDRRSSESIKWRLFGEAALPMWVADMDFRSPEPVIRALHERVEHGIFGYPEEPPELRALLVERMTSHYHWQVKAEEILFLPGVINSFNLVCHAATQPGDDLVIQTPVYPPFFSVARNTATHRLEVPLVEAADGSYGIDHEAFEAALSDRARVFILCNPHNPVGRVFRREELQRLAKICVRHGVLICSDEIHCDLVYTGQAHIPIASLGDEVAQNTVTLMAPSKTFNIAGLECSFAIVQNAELRQKMQAARKGLLGGVNLLGLTAGLAAYRECQDWLDELLVYLEANRDLVFDFVNQQLPGVRMTRPEGTYLAWLDCRQAGLLPDPAEFFIKEAGVVLNSGSDFGAPGNGFVRLNFGCPRSLLVEGLERLRQALAR
jgi:cystathionine beta-lyase